MTDTPAKPQKRKVRLFLNVTRREWVNVEIDLEDEDSPLDYYWQHIDDFQKTLNNPESFEYAGFETIGD